MDSEYNIKPKEEDEVFLRVISWVLKWLTDALVTDMIEDN